MFHVVDKSVASIEANIDEHGDSYARDLTLDEIQKVSDTDAIEATNTNGFTQVIHEMHLTDDERFENFADISQSGEIEFDDNELFASMFRGLVLYVACNSTTLSSPFNKTDGATEEDAFTEPNYEIVRNFISFAGGLVSSDWQNNDVTHIVCPNSSVSSSTKSIIAR